MKRKILKVVGVFIVSLISFTLCFSKLKNVSASIINDYQKDNYWFQGATEYNDINEINDLKGKVFNFNPVYLQDLSTYGVELGINIFERDYVGIEINEQTHETIQCVDYLLYPYLIMENPIENTYKIMSFYFEISDNYSFFYIEETPLNENANIFLNGIIDQKINNYSYFPIDSTINYDIPLSYTKPGVFSIDSISQTVIINYNNYNFQTEENFLNSLTDSNYKNKSLYTNYYFCFPNTDRYTLTFNLNNPTIFNDANFIQPYNANIEDKIAHEIEVANNAYNNGYNAGYNDGSTSGIFSIFTGVISSVNNILQMEIFPNVKLGYFIWLPLTLGIVGLILTFWRKD